MTIEGNSTNITIPLSSILNIEQYVLIMASCTVVWMILSVMGIVTNVINIRTFIAMGLSDGVTVSFLILAVIDLSYLIMAMGLTVSMIMHVIELSYNIIFPIEPLSMVVYFFNMTVILNTSTTLSTTFIAVARCMCVALPLHFKNLFTVYRATVFNIGFILVSVVCYIPLLANMSLVPKFDQKINITRPTLVNSPKREFVKVIVWMIVNMVIPFLTQIIVVICVIILASCLRAAAKFRQAMKAQVTVKETTKEFPDESDPNSHVSGQENSTEGLSNKDLRVVQQVVLISAVFIVCNIPKMMVSVTSASVHPFAMGRRYAKLYLCVNSLSKHCEIFNSAINLVVYYKYNTKFRTTMNFCSPKTN